MDISKIIDSFDAGGAAGVGRAVAELTSAECDELIRHALHPSVAVDVLFAALDRHMTLAWLNGPEIVTEREDPYLQSDGG